MKTFEKVDGELVVTETIETETLCGDLKELNKKKAELEAGLVGYLAAVQVETLRREQEIADTEVLLSEATKLGIK